MNVRRVLRHFFVKQRWIFIVSSTLFISLLSLIYSINYALEQQGSPQLFESTSGPANVLIPDGIVPTQENSMKCRALGSPLLLMCIDGIENFGGFQMERHIQDTLQIKRLLQSFSEGQFVYNRMTEMWRDAPGTVLFKLNPASEPAPSIPATLPGERAAGKTPITPEMSVELLGSAGLEVTPPGPVRKRVSDLAPTTWQWKVTPINTGDQFLTLSVFIHIDDEGPFTLKSFEDEIQVKVTAWQQTIDAISAINPVWAFVVGAIPVLWGVYTWIRAKLGHQRRRTDSGRR